MLKEGKDPPERINSRREMPTRDAIVGVTGTSTRMMESNTLLEGRGLTRVRSGSVCVFRSLNTALYGGVERG